MASLPVIQDRPLPLRSSGPLINPYNGTQPSKTDPPRALRSLAQIVDNGLCHRCGSCVGICPTNVLGVDDEEYPVVRNLSACTDCDLCVKICPGDEFNAPELAKQLYQTVPDPEDVYGSFKNGYLTFASDPKLRQATTSGGFVTAFLISLLEQGLIDGAIVVESDEQTPFKGKPKIARTKEELLASKKSKYAIVPTNTAFSEVLEVPGRYAMVGLPCQIHGFHKGVALDKRLGERIVVTIALICHAAIEHEPLKIMFERLGEKKKNVSNFIYRLEKHPGSSYVTMKDGTLVPVMFPDKQGYQPTAIELMNTLYRLYTPERCMTCYDSMGEFADISVGDPWMPKPFDNIDFHDGYTFIITRSTRGEELFARTVTRGDITSFPLTRSASRTSNLAMGTEKRYRAFRLLESKRRQGLPVPNYHFTIPEASLKHRFLTELNLLTHMFCFIPSFGKHVLNFALSGPGYVIYKINNKRRRLRTWRRDLMAKWGRKHSTIQEPDEHW